MRVRFRDGWSEPKPLVPGEVTRVRFTMNDVLHTFQRGHRFMIQVQSSWFPFIDRNPQTFVPNIFEAKDSDFVKANHRIHRDAVHASSVSMPVL
jgi:predicted acyl esterase